MSVTAFEVLVNGKKLFVAGIEGWQMLGANVHGYRLTPQMAGKFRDGSEGISEGSDGTETINLTCYVGLPDPENPGGSSGQPYGTRPLSVGDEVTIRVIKTDEPDPPLRPTKGGPTILTSVGSSENDKD